MRERVQHEIEPEYDPELGVAPKFTAARDGAGARVVRDAAGDVIAWPWDDCVPRGGRQHLRAKAAAQVQL